jgi:hypothetical protein
VKVDMSPQAVKARLTLVSQLWRLSVSLGNAKKETDKNRKNNIVSNGGRMVSTIILKD